MTIPIPTLAAAAKRWGLYTLALPLLPLLASEHSDSGKPDYYLLLLGVELIWTTVLTIFTLILSRKDAGSDKLEDRLHETTTKLVDERLRSTTHEIRDHVHGLLTTMEEMRGRIKDADGAMDGLSERDQKTELAMAAKFDQLKDYIRDNTASKQDVKDHENSVRTQMGQMSEKISNLGEKVAVLATKVEQR